MLITVKFVIGMEPYFIQTFYGIWLLKGLINLFGAQLNFWGGGANKPLRRAKQSLQRSQQSLRRSNQSLRRSNQSLRTSNQSLGRSNQSLKSASLKCLNFLLINRSECYILFVSVLIGQCGQSTGNCEQFN